MGKLQDKASLRNPFESELDFFNKNPDVAGMATEDNMVILNPNLPPEARDSMYKLEASRVKMRKMPRKKRPSFEITPLQAKQFENYSKDPQDIRETIASRILTSDPSMIDPTQDQMWYVRKYLEND